MKRIEKKYVFSQKKLNFILQNAKVFKEHYPRKISSIYFDTNDFKDYKDNFEGTVPRKKVRIRFYGNDEIPNLFKINDYYLEIKSTTYSSRYKKSIHFKSNLKTIINLVNSENFSKKKRFPKTFVTYERNYYKTICNTRITIDKNIVYKKINHNLALLNSYREKDFVLEVKNEKFDKDDTFEYDFLENFRVRFSKYSNSVKHNYF